MESDQNIKERFELTLKREGQRLTHQRQEVFERIFATHEHFTAEGLYQALRQTSGGKVSRATVYRTLDLLERGGFVNSFNTGLGEKVYEHIAGHDHHDHMVCRACGMIVEFVDARIERLQAENARRHGFKILRHILRLEGLCQACQESAGEP